MLRGRVYGAAGPPAAVATATAAAILGPYCTGSRCGHVTAPARPSLLYAAGREDERARALAPPPAPRAAARERAGRPRRWPRPRASGLRPSSGACARARSDARQRGAPGARACAARLPAEAELAPSRKGFRADGDRVRSARPARRDVE